MSSGRSASGARRISWWGSVAELGRAGRGSSVATTRARERARAGVALAPEARRARSRARGRRSVRAQLLDALEHERAAGGALERAGVARPAAPGRRPRRSRTARGAGAPRAARRTRRSRTGARARRPSRGPRARRARGRARRARRSAPASSVRAAAVAPAIRRRVAPLGPDDVVLAAPPRRAAAARGSTAARRSRSAVAPDRPGLRLVSAWPAPPVVTGGKPIGNPGALSMELRVGRRA